MEHVPHPLFLELAFAAAALLALVYLLTRNGPEWKPPYAKVFFALFVLLFSATLVSHAFDKWLMEKSDSFLFEHFSFGGIWKCIASIEKGKGRRAAVSVAAFGKR